MQKILMLMFIAFLIISCSDNNGEEDHNTEEETTYSITIMSPTSDDQIAGESIELHINFDEENNGSIHHINVQITNETTGEVIYNKPEIPHVHVPTGHYEWHDDFTLDVEEGTNLVLTAKVWGHEDGLAETTENISFEVK